MGRRVRYLSAGVKDGRAFAALRAAAGPGHQNRHGLMVRPASAAILESWMIG